MLVWAI